MPKRVPIDYTPQFGGGVFRAKDAIESDLALIDQDETAESMNVEISSTRERRPVTVRSTVSTNERTNERTRVRHSFDIWQDQLMALAEIQTQIFNRTGRKPKLGDLVQEALDAYVAKQRK